MAISPPGFISVSGFGVSSFFYKNMLDELGIDINLFRVGEYKGAAETYVRTDFSKENEEQYLNLLDYRMSNYLDKISTSRAIDRDNLFNMIENFETELANDALDNQLIDSLIYEDEMVNYLKTKVDSSYKKISLLKYRKTLEKNKYAKEIGVMNKSLKLSQSIESNKTVSFRVLAQIASAVPKRVKFKSIEYNGVDQIVIEGSAFSDQDILKLISNLNNKKLISQASLASMTLPEGEQQGSQKMKGFRIACILESA